MLYRVPRHPVAWLLCLAGLHWCADGAAASWLAYATYQQPVLPGAAAAVWAYQRLGAGLLIYLPLLLLIYPDGRLPTGRGWRIGAWASLAAGAFLPLVSLVIPADIAQARSGTPLPAPFAGLNLDQTAIPLPDGWWAALLNGAFVAVPLSMLLPFAVVIRRYRSATGDDDKARMRWLLWAAVVDVLVMVSAYALPAFTGYALGPAVGLTGAAIAIAIVRPHLIDIDRLLGSTLLYGAMAVTVLAVDACVLGVTGAVLNQQLPERDAAVVALLVVTAAYGPLRHRLWLVIRRLVLGRRDDPYRVVAGLAERLEQSDSPEDELLAVDRSVAEAFKSRYVAVEVDQVTAGYGTPPDKVRSLPITYRGGQIGRLLLPAQGPRITLNDPGRAAARRPGPAGGVRARTARLAREVQKSREQIVGAREEERRRLRRDLHDGLGPALGGVALRIDTARNLAAKQPAEADKLLKQAREDVTTAVADVRRLVHDLRPPALDDVGLLGAVRQQAARLRTPGLTVTVEGGDGLDSLPAAVEVAAYRIASEALVNVAKHAHASRCTVTLAVADGELRVCVRDNGVGIRSGTPTGVGLVSLRERAAELGGDCRIECPDEHGTLVQARLPLALAEVRR
jgi:signal transduction histidine kinase